ncbi:MAG TPA: 2'-5' RNA ligase family protein [Arachidicoccus soli]|nr:2'-5' RNA ligase family protein [Arachidicoccus soli]
MDYLERFDPYTYLLILHPDESVNGKIMEQKKAFAEKNECPSCVYSKPHITLIKFFQATTMESLLVRRICNYAQSVSSFNIRINGFGSFPSHTIYIKVQTKNEIIQLVKNLRELQLPLKFDKDHKPHFITEPHITIARKLLPWQYEKGWLEWSHLDFSASFMTNDMVLLKRKDERSKYQIVAYFPFEGKRQTIQQTFMF